MFEHDSQIKNNHITQTNNNHVTQTSLKNLSNSTLLQLNSLIPDNSNCSHSVIQKKDMGETGFISDLKYFLNSYGAYVKEKNDNNEFFIDSVPGKAVSDWGHLHVFISGETITTIKATYHDGHDKAHSDLILKKTYRGSKISPLYSLTLTNVYGETIAELIEIFNDASSSVANDDIIIEDSE